MDRIRRVGLSLVPTLSCPAHGGRRKGELALAGGSQQVRQWVGWQGAEAALVLCI